MMRSRYSVLRHVLPVFLLVSLALSVAVAGRAPSRIVAIADVHGAYDELTTLLQRTNLIDANRRWIGGSATFVQTGDVLDRGARSRECLDLMMELERQAPRQGGAVVPLLGNHEVMNVMGDLRYVTKEIYRTFATADAEKKRGQAYTNYLKFLDGHKDHAHATVPPTDAAARTAWMEAHPAGLVEYREAFGPRGTYGKWIRAHRAVFQAGDGIFVHGGLNPALDVASVGDLDGRVRAELAAFDVIWRALVDQKLVWRYMTLKEAVEFVGEEVAWLRGTGKPLKAGAITPMLLLADFRTWLSASADGPLWFRGLAQGDQAPLLAGVTAMLARLQARFIVVGHSVESKVAITTRFENRVFLLDTGMLAASYGGRPSALEIQDGRFTAHYANGDPVALPSPPGVAKLP
jgi:hypothetical protein